MEFDQRTCQVEDDYKTGCERMGHERDVMLTMFVVVMKGLSVSDPIIVHQRTDEADGVAGRTANIYMGGSG